MSNVTPPPLRILVYHHPDSGPARKLAEKMYNVFVAEPGQLGTRIPMLFGPDRPDGLPPESPEHGDQDLVVALLDQRMARRSGEGATAAQWGDFLTELAQGDGPGKVILVALDSGAFEVDRRLDEVSMVRLDVQPEDRRVEMLALEVAVQALHLLGDEELAADSEAIPVELFLSHAKGDLPRDPDSLEGPVKALIGAAGQRSIKHWYDAQDIRRGMRFPDEIRAGVARTSVMVCVVTDSYSDREWCRRELLLAKSHRRPIVVVDAIHRQVSRLFPYLGNVPIVRWESDDDARLAIFVAVREALRYRHNLAVLRARQQQGDHILGVAPELITVTDLPEGVRSVVYPDPPLGQEELDEVRKVLPEGIELTTPLSRVARWTGGAEIDLVALSLSNSSDLGRHGMSIQHLATLADDLAVYLLLAGLGLAYGGAVGHGGDSGTNYVERLLGMVRSYSPMARQLDTEPKPLANYVAWPIHLGFDDKIRNMFGSAGLLHELPRPPDLDSQETGYFSPDTAQRRYEWARSLTYMRETMTAAVTARVALGGKLEDYSGAVPGVVEEALLCLRAAKPLYLIGAFGGATRLIIDLLEGRERVELSDAWAEENVSHYKQVVALYRVDGASFTSPDEMVQELREFGGRGPARAMRNGLDDDQNRELFTATDPVRIVELILGGLQRWSQARPAT